MSQSREQIITDITTNIVQNDEQQITGDKLQSVLVNMANNLATEKEAEEMKKHGVLVVGYGEHLDEEGISLSIIFNTGEYSMIYCKVIIRDPSDPLDRFNILLPFTKTIDDWFYFEGIYNFGSEGESYHIEISYNDNSGEWGQITTSLLIQTASQDDIDSLFTGGGGGSSPGTEVYDVTLNNDHTITINSPSSFDIDDFIAACRYGSAIIRDGEGEDMNYEFIGNFERVGTIKINVLPDGISKFIHFNNWTWDTDSFVDEYEITLEDYPSSPSGNVNNSSPSNTYYNIYYLNDACENGTAGISDENGESVYYDWISFNDDDEIITLRNTGDIEQTIYINSNKTWSK